MTSKFKLKKKFERWEKEYKKLRNKFILNEKETKIWEFFNSMKCDVCGSVPSSLFPSHRIIGDIYCYDCWGKLRK